MEKHVLYLLIAIGLAFSETAIAETVALWTFDDASAMGRGDLIHDASGNDFHLELGAGRIVEDGKFGRAISCLLEGADFAARRLGIQGSRLNLGNFDWTVEWWQRREGPPGKGSVDWAYMIYDEAAGRDNPQWEAGYQSGVRLLGAGLWRHDLATTVDGEAVYWNCFVDKYDEVARIAFTQDVQPRHYSGQDKEFHHIAWVYDAQIKRLMYFEDGQGPFYVRDGAAVTPGNQTNAVYGLIGTGELRHYPAEYSDYGQFGEIAFYLGERRGAGTAPSSRIGIAKTPPGFDLAPRSAINGTGATIIDEMRVSDEVRYRQPFSPPASFAEGKPDRKPGLLVNPRQFNFVAFDETTTPQPQTLTVTWHSSDGVASPQLTAKSDVEWLTVTPVDSAGGTRSSWRLEVHPRLAPSTLSASKVSISRSDDSSTTQSTAVTLFLESSSTSTWRFDESVPTPIRFQLEDESPNGFDLQLGAGGTIVEGQSGGALGTAQNERSYAASRRAIDSSHLNLGNFDWTVEGWFQRRGKLRGDEQLLELRENVAVGPYPHLDGVGQRTALSVEKDGSHLRFVNEPSGCGGVRLATDPKVLNGVTPEWFHLSVGFNAASGTIAHWINGRLVSQAHVKPLKSLPATGENALALGSSVSGDNAWNGLIDNASIGAWARELADFTPPHNFVAKGEPVRLMPGPHLFFDDHLIASSHHLNHTMHEAQHPVDAPPQWDEFLTQHPNGGDVHLADLGSRAANPKRRFLRYQYVHSYSEAQKGGIYCYHGPSREGPWISYERNPVLPYIWAGQPYSAYSVSDHWPVIYDDRTEQLVLIYKTYPLAGQHPVLDWYRDERFNYQNRVVAGFRRHQGIAFSKDGFHWRRLQQVFVPDDDDEGEAQFQSPMLYRRGDLYIALIQVLRDDVDRSVAWLSCATSRDLLHWKRRREPFVPVPRDPRRGDRWVLASGNSEIYSDERWMYFPIAVRGSHKPPRADFRTFAKLPLDRFASLDSGDEETGTLVTPAIQLSGDVERMQLNGATAKDGELRVRVLNDQGQAVPGYDFNDCVPIAGDEMRHTVKWRSGKELNQIRERPIRLEFSVRRGSLYAFYLVGTGWQGETDYISTSKRLEELAKAGEHFKHSPREIRQLLDIQQAPEEATDMKISPAHVSVDYEIPSGFGYAGDPAAVALEVSPRDELTNWSISETIPWLSVFPREGRGASTVSVRFHGTYLSRGSYLGKILIESSGPKATRTAIPACIQIR